MLILTCADLERIGVWSCSKCCRSCHAGGCLDDELVVELPESGARLELCCLAGVDVALTGEEFARLLARPATSASPASPPRPPA